MAEVSGLRNRNHFDSNCSRDRDEGKSAALDGHWADGEPPVAVGGGRLGVFIPLFSLKFRRLCAERSVFSVSRIHLFSVAAPWCPAHQHPRCPNLFTAPKCLQRGLETFSGVKNEQVVIHACAARPRQAAVVLPTRTPTPVASGRHFHLHGGPASSRRSSRPVLLVGRLSTSEVSAVPRLSRCSPLTHTSLS